MNPTRLVLLLLCYCFTFATIFAQQIPDFGCGFDGLRNPAQEQNIQNWEEQLALYFSKKENHEAAAQKALSGLPYTVPVVVHIIHDGGAENIADAQVQAAIEHLNQAFAAQGYFAQQGATVHTQIQFCLAKRDPDDQATSGITRTQSTLTNIFMETQDLALKNLSRWNPKDYVNIWVVREISSLYSGPGVAGYAYFPSSHGKPEDGMVCEARFFGTSPAEDAILIHEMGHYFGLYHTFEGGCKNDNCQLNGDRVCDTPPDKATHTGCPYNSCQTDVAPGSPFTEDVPDYTGDFMDYSPFSCYQFFTDGQALRMQGAVETTRSSLLASKGCVDPCTLPIDAAFAAAPNPVVAGGTVVFTNNSTGATIFSWSENGTTFSQNQHTSRVFDTPGLFPILLTAQNGDPNCTDTAQALLKVLCPVQADFSASALQAPAGSTLVFTSTSTGNGPLQFDWSINGQPVGTGATLSFPFPNVGYYTVSLRVTGAFCQDETAAEVNITSTCGTFAEPVQLAFTASLKLFRPRDLLALPGGFLVQCGSHYNRPMVTKWDAWGKLLWHRVTTDNGAFNQVLPSPDGHLLLVGQANGKMLVAKMDKDGNFLWSKTLENTEGSYWTVQHKEAMAVNPDGSFGLLFIDNYAQKRYLLKLSPNGDVLWSRKMHQLGPAGFLRRATDGSGDFVFLSYGTFNTTWGGLSVVFFNQNGQFKAIHNHDLPFENLELIKDLDLSMHPDGGYSIFFTDAASPASLSTRRFLIRVDAFGQTKWARRYTSLTGSRLAFSMTRQLPNDAGWFVIESRIDANGEPMGDFLERLDANGTILWARRWGNTAENDDWVVPPVFQSGRIRGIHTEGYNPDMHLLTIPDSKLALSCVPVVTVNTKSIMVQSYMIPTNIYPTPFTLSMADAPQVLANDALSRSEICTAVLPCPELCDNQLDDDADGYVDCYDTDCLCTEIDTSCMAKVLKPEFSARLGWQSAVDAVSTLAVPLVANLNPAQDSMPEIIVAKALPPPSMYLAQTILIFKGDGSNATGPDSLALPVTIGNKFAAHPTVADLDRNGIPELILVHSDQKIRIYTDFNPQATPCMKLWATSVQTVWSENSRAYVADFNSDGISEIYSGNDVFQLNLSNPSAPVLTKVLDGSGAVGQLSGFKTADRVASSTAADLLTRSDCNGDPDCDGLEIAAGYSIYSIDIDPTDGDGLQIKVHRNLNNLDPNIAHEDGYTAVADLDLDGTAEVIVSGRRDKTSLGGIYAWNKNGLVQDFTDESYSYMNGQVCVANVYDDKSAGFGRDFPELIVCQSNGIFCLNVQKAQATPDQPYWWSQQTTDLSGITSATVFDFNGDGVSEIVYRDHTELRVMYGGASPFPAGVDFERNWYKMVAGSGTADEYPVVADVDRDGEAEIVVTSLLTPFGQPYSPDLRGRLRVLESAARPWRPARQVWNQFNYFGLNIDDDLTVPKTQQKHWLEMGGIGSGKRPFNQHLAQLPPELLLTDKIPAPDAGIFIDSTHCRTDSFDVFLTICNQGAAILPAGTPIAFYKENPTTTAAPLLFPPLVLADALKAGSCKPLKLTIPASYNAAIFAVVNDNGSLSRPFNLPADFPSTNQGECHYGNNITSFYITRPQLLLNLGPDVALCQNSVVELSANPNFHHYRWQDGSTAPTYTAFTPGKYWVDAYDACGFRKTDTVNIALNNTLALNLPDEKAICAGTPAPLEVSGFSSYSWTPADSVSCPDCASVNILAKSSITLYLTAANGDCLVSDSIRVTVHPKPALQLVVQDGDCGMPGIITANTFGAEPFAFLWSDSSSAAVLFPSQSGTYTVEITDTNGCQTQASAAVSISPALAISTTTSAPVCAGTQTGSIDVTVGSGSSPFQFLWSNSATTEDLINVPSGAYTLSATDANGCTALVSETLNDPTPLILSLESVTNTSCSAASDGAATVTATGGSGTLDIRWSNDQTGPVASGLTPGNYTVTVTDANSCTATTSAIILAVDQTSPVIQASAVTLSLGPSGSVTLTGNNLGITVTDNCQVSSVLIDPETFDCDDLGTQEVTLTATDNSGNTISTSIPVTIVDNSAPTLVCSPDLIRCALDSVVEYEAPVATDNCLSLGGQFALTQGLPSGSAFPTGSTTNVYTFTDAQGNAGACSFVVTILSPLAVVLDSVIHDVNGQHIGSVQVTVSGSLPGYSYQWTLDGQTVATTKDLDGAGSGAYFLSVADTLGCTTSAGPFVVDNVSGTQTPGLSGLVRVYPNPTAGAFFVVFSGELTSAGKQLSVFDATGRAVLEQFDDNRKKITVDMSHLPEGLYSVLIRVEGRIGMWKVIKVNM